MTWNSGRAGQCGEWPEQSRGNSREREVDWTTKAVMVYIEATEYYKRDVERRISVWW